MKYIFSILFLIVWLLSAQAQTDSVYFTEDMFSNRLEELRQRHGLYKSIPKQYELGILVALSFYPELDSVPIDFVLLPIRTTMMAQPRTRTFFKGRENRRYVIFINTRKKNTGFLPSELSFNQFIGVMGHELGHISYYIKQSAFQLLIDALGYYNHAYKKEFEKGTDMIAIEHSLGWQLLDFTDFIMNKAPLSKSYARNKKRHYMTEKELYQILRQRVGK